MVEGFQVLGCTSGTSVSCWGTPNEGRRDGSVAQPHLIKAGSAALWKSLHVKVSSGAADSRSFPMSVGPGFPKSENLMPG